MVRSILVAALAALSGAEAAHAGPAAAAPTYILDGFRLSGVEGVDQDALVATLQQKPGDRISTADIAADTKALSTKLRERNIEGDLFATMAEKKGHIWVLFDFQPPRAAPATLKLEGSRLDRQDFDGNVRISGAALQAATGLKVGDALSVARINAARQAILAAYSKAAPGEDVRVGGRIRVTPGGKVELTWHVTEPK